MLLAQRIDNAKANKYLFYLGDTFQNVYLEGDYAPVTRDRFSLYLSRFYILKSLE